VDSSKSQKIFPKIDGPVKQTSGEDKKLPPWLFQHRTLTDALENAKPVKKETLTNILNHIHFINGYVFALLGHPKYEESILIKAYPEPCLGSKLTCRWSNDDPVGIKPEEYKFQYVIIIDGRALILVPATVQEIDNKHFTFELPSLSHAVGQRQTRRYPCRNVTVELIQSGFLAKGELLDFSPMGFRIRVKPERACSFQWFNSDELATVHLRNEQQILFSGACEYIRQRGGLREREIVLSPSDEKISRFKKSKVRNPRKKLSPSPDLFFNHPFYKKRMQLEVLDISTSGLSVREKANVGVLMPGMIIPELTINFAGLKVKCTAQVIYCLEEKKNGTRYGIAILDMDINAYSCLTNILANAIEPHAYINAEVDIDALWKFFFETDFIYQTKYHLVQSRREEFKKTFQKLYRESPEIAKHFTYQENGRIYGHVSMVRAYEKTWMVQHLAARTMAKKLTGLTVLKQILHYLNDMFRLPSLKTDYAMVCFRPDKKFPDTAFGGFARALNNPKGCSMDLFSYLPYTTLSIGTRLPEGWSLKQCSSLDLWEMGRFYNNHSGGLLLKAMQLTHENSSNDSLENLYDRLGFSRRWKAYSLTHYDELNAVLIVEESDLGLNLSELLNGIKIVVTNLEGLPWNILSTAIGQLAPLYNKDKVPILIYPLEYVTAKTIPYEKQYQLWIYHARFMGQFMEFLKQRIRVQYWE
jgi:hypothetical protein